MTSLKKAQAFLGFLMAAAAIGTVVLVSRPAPEPIDRFWFWVGIVGGPLAMAGLLWLFIGLERTRIATDGEGWIAWAKATVKMWRCPHPASSLVFLYKTGGDRNNQVTNRCIHRCTNCGATLYLSQRIEVSND